MKRVAELTIEVRRQGLHEITVEIARAVRTLIEQGALGTDGESRTEGLCTIFVRHTSASLTIQENADPSARRDLENWLNRLVPEDDPLFTHTSEGPDDMPSHIKAALTSTSLSVPIVDGRMALGTWQGVYLWEHRRPGGFGKRRKIAVHVG